jgi:hypothetical protein
MLFGTSRRGVKRYIKEKGSGMADRKTGEGKYLNLQLFLTFLPYLSMLAAWESSLDPGNHPATGGQHPGTPSHLAPKGSILLQW